MGLGAVRELASLLRRVRTQGKRFVCKKALTLSHWHPDHELLAYFGRIKATQAVEF